MMKKTIYIIITAIILVGCTKESEYLRLPIVETTSVEYLGEGVIEVTGKILDDGNTESLSIGFCYDIGKKPEYMVNNQILVYSTLDGVFTTTIPDLIRDSTYYFQSFIVNDQGYAKGSVIEFTIPPYEIPTVPCDLTTNQIIYNRQTYNSVTSDIETYDGKYSIVTRFYPQTLTFKFEKKPHNGIYTTNRYDNISDNDVFVTIENGGYSYNPISMYTNQKVYVHNIDDHTTIISFCNLIYPLTSTIDLNLVGEVEVTY